MTKEQCVKAIDTFRIEEPVERSDEDLIATIDLMNNHGVERVKALDQSSQGGNDNGIDAWHFKDGELFIYQSKLTQIKATTLKGLDDLARARDWIERVLVDGEVGAVPKNSCLYNLFKIGSDLKSSCKKISFVLLSLFEGDEIRKAPEFQEFSQTTAKSRLNSFLSNDRHGRVVVDADLYDLETRVPYVFG